MRALVQCVSSASVSVDGNEVASIGRGYLVFLGVGDGDTDEQARKLWSKIFKMRVFEDSNGKTNQSLSDIGGDVLVVSQFTLYADCRKGNRPSFSKAMEPVEAKRLYELFVEIAKEDVENVGTGVFGAMMDVALVNRGPFTIYLDTDEL
ncbi:MAG: D-aminoacyl-tRNA deacylase [Coriobacteriales bacterium]|jgi:D-tyrosyl-tRNA(Tyr) deacylase